MDRPRAPRRDPSERPHGRRGRRLTGTLLSQALARCRRAAPLTGGSLLLGLSGGKDSLVTADVVLRSDAFSRVEAFAMHLVPGLECFELPIRRFAEDRRLPVHFVPHWDLSRLFKHAVLRHHIPGAHQLRQLGLKDVERALTAEHGIDWFGYGERAADSYARRLYTRKDDGISVAWRRFWPIYDWLDRHVYAYLKAQRIPTPERFGAARSAGGSGITLAPACLLDIKRRHPSDYRKILAVFPLAEAQVWALEHGVTEPRKGNHDHADETEGLGGEAAGQG